MARIATIGAMPALHQALNIRQWMQGANRIVAIVGLAGTPLSQIYLILCTEGEPMSYKEICDIYDNNPNMTLAELSRITGLPVAYLKSLLMKG